MILHFAAGCLPIYINANLTRSIKDIFQNYDKKTVNFLFLFSIYKYL